MKIGRVSFENENRERKEKVTGSKKIKTEKKATSSKKTKTEELEN